MGSRGSPNPWPPYPGYRDCSQGICSIYCPQWCYIIFPPPPPSYSSAAADDDSGSNFSPLIIAVIGILSSAFLLIAYYALISRYCKRRRSQNLIRDIESNQAQTNHDNYQLTAAGLEESVIKSIGVCKYKSGDGLVEGTECSVCLSEFVENESLRLLPKCSHAFHLPCIDTWLKSHSSCPMCRANIAADSPPSDNGSTLNMSSLRIQQRHDMVAVEQREELVGDVVLDQVQQVVDRRSSLRGSQQRQLSVADILNTDDDDEEEEESERVLSVGIGSSGTAEMKRSASTGKL